jgi:alkylation response protein AidB-like acyl-CoA dehydrogenase
MIDRSALEPSELPGEEERTLLRDSLRGFVEANWPAAAAVELGKSRDSAKKIWSLLAGQGVAGLGSEPTEGGLREICVAMEELGRIACAAPLLGATLANLAWSQQGGAMAPSLLPLLHRVHTGSASICWSFGSYDPDHQVGQVSWKGECLSGTLRFVDAALAATHLIVGASRDGCGVAVVELDSATVVVTPTRALGGDGLAQIILTEAPAIFVPLDESLLADLSRIARIALLARAYGAARRAFEMAVDYAKERRQFGQPIGRFQAIQHKLADNLIALEGVRVTLVHAAQGFDLGDKAWRYFAAAAVAFGGPALRRASLETHHAFGAIGYSEEHEAPRHFKRVHLDVLAFGGARAARAELAAHLLDDANGTLPEYDLGHAGNQYRTEVRSWLQENWSGARKAAFDRHPFEEREFDASFARDLGKTGWLGLGWPGEFGGQSRTPLEQLAFMEVMERAEVPPRFGASVQANALMMFGTPAQKARYLPEILRGEAMHGMGYSEPEAGSDLASLRTSAVWIEGHEGGEGHWLINGQKIWTTTWWGKYMFLAARTDRDAKPAHAGISMFIVPMDSDGITVKPATTMYDGSFANIFYDDVRLSNDALIGPLNGGWKVLTGALANERGLVGGGIVLKVAHAFDLLCRDVRIDSSACPLYRDPQVRDRIATLAAEIEVGRRLMIHCAQLATSGITPPEVGAISKVFSGELMERFGEAALDILGVRATLSQDAEGAIRSGRYEQGLRHSMMWVISIGTNEIQRSLIAQRGLGLPR